MNIVPKPYSAIRFGETIKLHNSIPPVPPFKQLYNEELALLVRELDRAGTPSRIVKGKPLNRNRGNGSFNDYLIFDGNHETTLTDFNKEEAFQQNIVSSIFDTTPPVRNTRLSLEQEKQNMLDDFMESAARQLDLFTHPPLELEVNFGPTRKYMMSGKEVDGDFKIENQADIIETILDLKA